MKIVIKLTIVWLESCSKNVYNFWKQNKLFRSLDKTLRSLYVYIALILNSMNTPLPVCDGEWLQVDPYKWVSEWVSAFLVSILLMLGMY